MAVAVAPGVGVEFPASSTAALHVQVEALQAAGQLEAALEAAQKLPPSDIAAVSVAELLSELERWQDLLDELEETPRLASDAARLTDVYVASALQAQGSTSAADTRLREVLAADALPEEIRLSALALRISLAEASGRADVAAACRRSIARLDADHPALLSLERSAETGVVAVTAETLLELRSMRDRVADQVVERERRLAEAQIRIDAFTRRYVARVGRLIAAVDSLRARLAEARLRAEPDAPGARAEAEAAADTARASEQACREESGGEEPEEREAPGPPTEELKAAYRRAARLMHPDMALDEADRLARTEMMARLNAAYAARDADAVARVIAEWESVADDGGGVGATSEAERLRREISRLEARLTELDEQLDGLAGDAMWRLMTAVEEAENSGEDLLARMADTLRQEQDELQDELLLLEAL